MMKRASLIFLLVLATALVGCSDDEDGNGGETGGETGGSAAIVLNLLA